MIQLKDYDVREAVTWGYRLFLDREPESQIVVEDKTVCVTSEQLRRAFMDSEEFQRKPSHGNKMKIEYGDVDIDLLLKKTAHSWQKMGESEPFFSVLTSDAFLKKNINFDQFYATGTGEVEKIFDIFYHNDIDSSSLKSCLEYGCGTGRVTRWLVDRFSIVYGYDISKPHIKIAEENAPGAKFYQIKDIQDLDRLPRVDFVYSTIVLQHNPPPVIEYILRRLLRCLNRDGVALFQVPTYLPGYTFSIKEYLDMVNHEMEMHAVPQATVFQVVYEEGCIPVSVTTDASTLIGVSNVFLVRKQI